MSVQTQKGLGMQFANHRIGLDTLTTTRRAFLQAGLLTAGGVLVPSSWLAEGRTVGPAAIDPTSYPALDDKQLGHVRHMVRLANQLDGEWAHMGIKEGDQEGDDGYRYQLASMSYALALTHYHRLPAYRELFRDTIDHLIRKMLRRDVWGYWENTSRGSRKLDPDLKQLADGWIDPVKDQNIMYSAHLLCVVGLYAALFRDRKYDEPGALTFVHNPVWRGIRLDRDEFKYDAPALAEKVFLCLKKGQWLGCECEPNANFVLCNQPTLIGLRLHDQTHGTKYFEDAIRKYEDAWKRKGGWVHKDGSFVAFLRMKQDRIDPLTAPNIDGMTGAWMHAWNRDFVRSVYPTQKKRWVRPLPDGTAYVFLGDEVDELATSDFGAMLIYASEVGDKPTRDALLRYADKYMGPVWDNGCYYYPRHDESFNKEKLPVYVNRHTGNALIAYARLNVEDGLWAILNRPWPREHFAEPFVGGVRFPEALVTQATYDKAKNALVVTVQAGTAKKGPTQFAVHQLDGAKVYRITRDGTTVGRLVKGVLKPEPDAGLKWSREKKELAVETDLARPRTFVIRAEE